MYAPLSVGSLSESVGDSVCRLCLREGNSMTYIFDPKGWNGFRVWEIIKELIQLEISKDDGLPGTVCPSCLKKVVDYKYFKTMCINSKISFLTMIATRGMVASDSECSSVANGSIPHIGSGRTNGGGKTDTDDEIIEIDDYDVVKKPPIEPKESNIAKESSKAKDDEGKKQPSGKKSRKQSHRKGSSAKRRRISPKEDANVVESVVNDAPSTVEVNPRVPEVPTAPVATPPSTEERRDAHKTRQPAKKPVRKVAASKRKSAAPKPTEEAPIEPADALVDDSGDEYEATPSIVNKVPDIPSNPAETAEKRVEVARTRPPAKKRKKKASHGRRKSRRPGRPKKVSINFIEIPQPSATNGIQTEVIGDEFEIDLGDVEPAGRDPLSLVKEEEDLDTAADGSGVIHSKKSKGDATAEKDSVPVRRQMWEIGVNVKSEVRNNQEDRESSDDDRGTPLYMEDEEGSLGSEDEGREIEMDIVEEKYSAMLASIKSPSASKKNSHNPLHPQPEYEGVHAEADPVRMDSNGVVQRQGGVNFISFTVIPSNDDLEVDNEGDRGEIDPFACIEDDPNPSGVVSEVNDATPGGNYIQSIIHDPVIPVTESIPANPQGTAVANLLNQPHVAKIPIIDDRGAIAVTTVQHVSPMLIPISVTTTKPNIDAQLPRIPLIGVPQVPITVCNAVPLSLAVGAAPQLGAGDEVTIFKHPNVLPGLDRVPVQAVPMDLSATDRKEMDSEPPPLVTATDEPEDPSRVPIDAKSVGKDVGGSRSNDPRYEIGGKPCRDLITSIVDEMMMESGAANAGGRIQDFKAQAEKQTDSRMSLASHIKDTPQVQQPIPEQASPREGADCVEPNPKQPLKRKNKRDALDKDSSNDEWMPNGSEVSSDDSEDWWGKSKKVKVQTVNKGTKISKKMGHKSAPSVEKDKPVSKDPHHGNQEVVGPNPSVPVTLTTTPSVDGSDTPIMGQLDGLPKRLEGDLAKEPECVTGHDDLTMKSAKDISITGNATGQNINKGAVLGKVGNSSTITLQIEKMQGNDKRLTSILPKIVPIAGGISILRKPTADIRDAGPMKPVPSICAILNSSNIRAPKPTVDEGVDDVEVIKTVEVPKTNQTNLKAGDIMKAMSEKLFKCNWCEVVGHGVNGIAKHMKAAHKIRIHQEVSVYSEGAGVEKISKSSTKLNCKLCGMEFTSLGDLYVHNLYICRKDKVARVTSGGSEIETPLGNPKSGSSVLKNNIANSAGNFETQTNPPRTTMNVDISQLFQKQMPSQSTGTNAERPSVVNSKRTNLESNSLLKTTSGDVALSKDDSSDCQPLSVMIRTYRCKYCPGKYKNKAEFKAHRMSAHGNIPRSSKSEEQDSSKSDGSCTSVGVGLKTVNADKGLNAFTQGKMVPMQPVAPFLVSARINFPPTSSGGNTVRTDSARTTTTPGLNKKDTIYPIPDGITSPRPCDLSSSNLPVTHGSRIVSKVSNLDNSTPNTETLTKNSIVTSTYSVMAPHIINTSRETESKTANPDGNIPISSMSMSVGFNAAKSCASVANPCVTSSHEAAKESNLPNSPKNRAINLLMGNMPGILTANPITSGDQMVSRTSTQEQSFLNTATLAHAPNVKHSAGSSTAISLNSAIAASRVSDCGNNTLNSPLVNCTPSISKASVITANPSLTSSHTVSSASNNGNSVVNSVAVSYTPNTVSKSTVTTASTSLTSSYEVCRGSDLGNKAVSYVPNTKTNVTIASTSLTSGSTASSVSNLGSSVASSVAVSQVPNITSKTSVIMANPSLTGGRIATGGLDLDCDTEDNVIVDSFGDTTPKTNVSTPKQSSSENLKSSGTRNSSGNARCTMCKEEFQSKLEVNRHFAKVHMPQLYEMQRQFQKNKPYKAINGS